MPDSDHIEIAITLNGESYRFDGDRHVTALIERLKMRATRVAVEINHEIVPKAKYAETVVRAGDEVEIINFVGGG
jgi:sulfur carrier protein